MTSRPTRRGIPRDDCKEEEGFSTKQEISAEMFERLVRALVNVWARDLKRGRNDANKHGSSKQLKARKQSR